MRYVYATMLVVALLFSLASCSRHSVGGHHPGGNLTKNYHDEHLGTYKHHGV